MKYNIIEESSYMQVVVCMLGDFFAVTWEMEIKMRKSLKSAD